MKGCQLCLKTDASAGITHTRICTCVHTPCVSSVLDLITPQAFMKSSAITGLFLCVHVCVWVSSSSHHRVIYMDTLLFIFVCVCISYVCVCVCVCVCVYVGVRCELIKSPPCHIYINLFTFICVCVCVYTCVCVWVGSWTMYALKHINTCTYLYTCIHVHAHNKHIGSLISSHDMTQR